MWTHAGRFFLWVVLLSNLLNFGACASNKKGASTKFQSQFPELKADTVHLASWCLKEDEPEFAQHLCRDSALAKALGLQSGSFRCYGRIPIDRRHTLYIVETYTGMCGTTFLPFMTESGVDTFALLSVPFASALYGDNEPEQAGDNISSEEADEAWLLDFEGDGDLDIVFSAWRGGCLAVLGDDGVLEAECEEEFPKPVVFVWVRRSYVAQMLPEAETFLELRHKRVE